MSHISRRALFGFTGLAVIAPLPWLGQGVRGSQSMTASPAASPAASPIPLATEITIEAIDFAFIEAAIAAPADAELTVTLVNNGRTAHDFVIDELDLHIEPVKPGESATFSFSGPAGEYIFYCSLNSHRIAGQEGTLTLF